jgi:hypothetical protein
MSETWFYSHEGRDHGPISTDELKRLAAAGVLDPDDMIWPAQVPHHQAVAAGAALDFAALRRSIPALPDWLADVDDTDLLPAPPAPGRKRLSDAPAWLAELEQLLSAPPSKPLPLPSWMLDFEPVEQAARTQAVPDWLTGFVPEEPPPSKPTAIPTAKPVAPAPTPPASKPIPLAQPVIPTAMPVAKPMAPPTPKAPPKTAPTVPLAAPAKPAPSPAAKKPVAAPPAPKPSIQEMGYDPDTGEVFDAAKFKKWQEQQNRLAAEQRAAQPAVASMDPFQKARRELADWIDREENQALIKANDRLAIGRSEFLQDFMRRQRAYGPEMVKKLCHYLDFMIENRRKFYMHTGEW